MVGVDSTRRFGGFELQPSERRLLSGDVPITLGTRAFELLLALTERPHHLHSKRELLARVWPRVVVEENALQAQISILRRVLGDHSIKTVQGRGYRFELDVETEAPPARPGEHHHLPYSGTTFVGRQGELRDVSRLLARHRLLTLTGSGGCGKTRLAVEFVRTLKSVFPDGIWFVDLACLSEVETVERFIATQTGCREEAGRSAAESLCMHWADRQGLVILDNAEHVLDTVAYMVETLLGACSCLALLVTSRQRLNVAGEQVYRIPAMTVPAPTNSLNLAEATRNESVELFVQRAQLVRPEFEVTSRNCAALVSVCRRLEGIPLSIELAAARLQMMSVEELNDHLRRNLSLLTGGSRSTQARQQSAKALIGWSVDLLSEPERDLLCCTTVFVGSWTLESAEAVCAGGSHSRHVLDMLTSLVDKSLVFVSETASGTRYRMLETVREFAAEQLALGDKLQTVQQRHFQHFLQLAEQSVPKALGENSVGRLDRIESDIENFRSALQYCERQRRSLEQARLVEALWRYWYLRGHFEEAERALDRASQADDEVLGTALAAKIHYALGTVAQVRGDANAGSRHLERALQLFTELGDGGKVAATLSSLGSIAKLNNDLEAASRLQEAALVGFRNAGDRDGQANSLNNLGNIAQAQRDFLKARSLHLEALAIRREINTSWGVANSLQNLASVSYSLKEYMLARTLAEEGYEIYRLVNDPRGMALARGLVGLAFNGDQLWVEAHETLIESARMLQRIGDVRSFLEVLFALAYSIGASDSLRAAQIWGAIASKNDELNLSTLPNVAESNLRQIASVRERANGPAFEGAWSFGRSISLERAFELAALPLEGASIDLNEMRTQHLP